MIKGSPSGGLPPPPCALRRAPSAARGQCSALQPAANAAGFGGLAQAGCGLRGYESGFPEYWNMLMLSLVVVVAVCRCRCLRVLPCERRQAQDAPDDLGDWTKMRHEAGRRARGSRPRCGGEGARLMHCTGISFSGHAVRNMFERRISLGCGADGDRVRRGHCRLS
jgi:hypothetical protein